MAVIPPGRLTRAQIVGLALRRAGNTVLSSAPQYEAQTWLNQILYDLYTAFTWPFLRTTATISVSGTGAFSLPADFLSTPEDDALAILTINTQSTYVPLAQLDPGTFYRAQGNGQSTGTPRWWVVDQNTTTARVYPQPNTDTYTMRLAYFFLPADIVVDASGDSTIPTFPWSDYLTQALYARVLQYEQDGRAQGEMAVGEAMLSKFMQRANSLRSQDPTIPLDAQVFGNYGWDGTGPGSWW